MNDLKTSSKSQMVKAWKTVYKTRLKSFTYERNLESSVTNPNNDPTAPNPYYDPVTETYIYPSGAPENLSQTLSGMIRTASKEAFSDQDLLASDKKITVLYDEFIAFFETPPQTSDKVTINSKEYRVKKASVDSIDCFIHIFIAGV